MADGVLGGDDRGKIGGSLGLAQMKPSAAEPQPKCPGKKRISHTEAQRRRGVADSNAHAEADHPPAADGARAQRRTADDTHGAEDQVGGRRRYKHKGHQEHQGLRNRESAKSNANRRQKPAYN